MAPGETILSGAPSTCPDCNVKVELMVCHSNAGYYIGTMCSCGPYSRESEDYYPTCAEAEEALKAGTWVPRS
jgi:hypothetical protein